MTLCDIAVLTDKDLRIRELVHTLQDVLHDYRIKLVLMEEFPLYKEVAIPDPDFVIIDTGLNINPSKVVDYFKGTNVKIVSLTSNVCKETLLNYFRLNLDGYLSVHMKVEEVVSAVKRIISGGKYIYSGLASILLEEYIRISCLEVDRPCDLLSYREWEILEQIAMGYSNQEISRNLIISEKTVKNHVASILKKLSVKDRLNAVLLAVKNNWVKVN